MAKSISLAADVAGIHAAENVGALPDYRACPLLLSDQDNDFTRNTTIRIFLSAYHLLRFMP